ncbi:MAG: VPLPA-CTERM sorting domain-containing protein [Gammaproteobacteria bacterium]
MKNTHTLAAAVALALGGTSAQGAVLDLQLVGASGEFGNNGNLAAVTTASTATWTVDTATGVVTGNGQYSGLYQISPVTQLFTQAINDLSIGGGLAAGATQYACIDGNFGPAIGAGLCGNYNFGGNFVNESTVSYGPGTAFSRTIGGDDVAFTPQESLLLYDGMTTTISGITPGSTVTVSNIVPFTQGYDFTFTVVPVPAAVWLFGSALGALGWARRRKQ